MLDSEAAPTDEVSERFPEATPTSIAFVSSDNVTFYIDRAKLDRAADFSPPALVSSSPTDPVRLAESSETLELLFRFVYCDVDIDLTSHSFYDIEKLAMSAEKYQVFSALAVCRLYMQNNMSSYPVGVMAYAARNGHRDILDAVAPHTLAKSARTMYEALPPAYMIAWTLYRGEYQDIAHDAVDHFPDYTGDHIWSARPGVCGQKDMDKSWQDLKHVLMNALLVNGMSALLDLGGIFSDELYDEMGSCPTCLPRLERYEKNLRDSVSKVETFSHFLSV